MFINLIFSKPPKLKRVIPSYVNEVNIVIANNRNGRNVVEEIEVSWSLSLENQVKLNTNGVVKHKENKAGCGVLIRDVNDKWLIGFVKNLSSYSAFVVKC